MAGSLMNPFNHIDSDKNVSMFVVSEHEANNNTNNNNNNNNNNREHISIDALRLGSTEFNNNAPSSSSPPTSRVSSSSSFLTSSHTLPHNLNTLAQPMTSFDLRLQPPQSQAPPSQQQHQVQQQQQHTTPRSILSNAQTSHSAINQTHQQRMPDHSTESFYQHFHHQQQPSTRLANNTTTTSNNNTFLTQTQTRFHLPYQNQNQSAYFNQSQGSPASSLNHRNNLSNLNDSSASLMLNYLHSNNDNFNDRNVFITPGSSNPPGLNSNLIGKRRAKLPFFTNSSLPDHQHQLKNDIYGAESLTDSDGSSEQYSRKVFVGGLPPDIDEEEIKASFRRFGSLVVDWPHKAESKSYFPPKGYAFLLFHEESSVQALIDSCLQEDDKLYLCVSSPTIKDKPVQIRPWKLGDADFVLDATLALDPRKTVFVGGVPRPLKASELANIMNNLYGGVCYAGIDTDPELRYPKGAGRVAFSNHQSYIAAISARFVHLHHSEIEKRVEVKPYVLDDQFCDECQGSRCGNKFAPFFCASITCLRYYCENCWSTIHSQPGREFHKPLVKEGADRPRGVPYRWC